MSLALFDLDNTLIGGDSDHLWGEFLIEQRLVDTDAYRAQNDRFYQDYQNGSLDIHAYLAFALAPLASMKPDQLANLHRQFMQEKIAPIQLPKAQALVEHHRARGDTLLVITATNRFITAPIVETFAITHLLASEPEMQGERYTGKACGIPCYQHGKVQRLRLWLEQHGLDLSDSYFYSDSINDIPLLEQVTYPVAVDPDERLRQYALERNIPILSLRD